MNNFSKREITILLILFFAALIIGWPNQSKAFWTEACGAATKGGCGCGGSMCNNVPAATCTTPACPARALATATNTCTYSRLGDCGSGEACALPVDCRINFDCNYSSGNCRYDCIPPNVQVGNACQAPAVCTHANPTVTLTPTPQNGNPGNPLNYTVTVTNNDTAGCAMSGFILSVTACPAGAGWTCTLSSAMPLTLNPGATNPAGSRTITVTSPVGAAANNYNITVQAVNGSVAPPPSYIGSGPGTYQVLGGVCTHNNPTVTFNPVNQSGNPGDSLQYTLNILNNDTAGCPNSNFTPSITVCPAGAGWTCALSSVANILIAPGATNQTRTITVTSSGSALNGSYTITARALNSNFPGFFATGSGTYDVSAVPCTHANPTVTISPASLTGSPGDGKEYAILVQNNDTAACSPSNFNILVTTCPLGGWSCLLAPAPPISVAPGLTNAAIHIIVTSPAGAVVNTYTFTVQAVNTTTAGYSGNGSGTYQVTGAGCTHSNPTVTLTPTPQSGNAGDSIQYTLKITNNDTVGCAMSGFQPTVVVCPIPGWSCTLSSIIPLPIAPGFTNLARILTVVSPGTAVSGTYTTKVTVDNGTIPGYTATASADYKVTAIPCNHFNPSVSLTPTPQNGDPGAPVQYTLSITNNDSISCPLSWFSNTPSTCPSGWSCDFTSNVPLPVAPGTTNTQRLLTVTSPDDATVGDYTIKATINNLTFLGYTATASAVYHVNPPPPCEIKFDKPSYNLGEVIGIEYKYAPHNSNLFLVGPDTFLVQQWKVSGSSPSPTDKTYRLLNTALRGTWKVLLNGGPPLCSEQAQVNVSAVCAPDGCNSVCPPGCEGGAADPDCICQGGNSCCGLGCVKATDGDCAAVIPSCVVTNPPCNGSNANCSECTVDQDPDCGCKNDNSCCGFGCDITNDNNCQMPPPQCPAGTPNDFDTDGFMNSNCPCDPNNLPPDILAHDPHGCNDCNDNDASVTTECLRGGLVPCGRQFNDPDTPEDETAPCTLCHFFVLIKRIVDFATLYIVIPVGVLMFVVGGVMFLTSSGDLGKIGGAKKILTASIIGLLIFLAAWMIVNTVIVFVTTGHIPAPGEIGKVLTQPWNEVNCSITAPCSGRGTACTAGSDCCSGGCSAVTHVCFDSSLQIVGNLACFDSQECASNDCIVPSMGGIPKDRGICRAVPACFARGTICAAGPDCCSNECSLRTRACYDSTLSNPGGAVCYDNQECASNDCIVPSMGGIPKDRGICRAVP